MILYYILVAILGIINTATFFLPQVSSLPLNMDNYLQMFFGTLHGVALVLPILTVPMATVALFYFLVSIRFVWDHVKWIIERVH